MRIRFKKQDTSDLNLSELGRKYSLDQKDPLNDLESILSNSANRTLSKKAGSVLTKTRLEVDSYLQKLEDSKKRLHHTRLMSQRRASKLMPKDFAISPALQPYSAEDYEQQAAASQRSSRLMSGFSFNKYHKFKEDLKKHID